MSENLAKLARDNGIDLDVWGVLEGVDKSSICGEIPCSWDYLRHYGEALTEFRDENINVLELGVANGASINMWMRYFSKATIIGIDISEECARFSRGRAIIKIGSQDDPVLLDSVATAHPLSVVIDDGSHIAVHMIASFQLLFPRLLPGGTYIIEDLAFHFADAATEVVAVQPAPAYPSEAFFNYFYKFLAAKAGHVTRLPGASAELNELYASIDSIQLIGGAIIIKKKKKRALQEYADKFEQKLLTVAIEGPEKYFGYAIRYAIFLLTYEFNIPRAMQLLHHVLSINGSNVLALQYLYFAAVKIGDAATAGQAGARLAELGEPLGLKPMYIPGRMEYPHP